MADIGDAKKRWRVVPLSEPTPDERKETPQAAPAKEPAKENEDA